MYFVKLVGILEFFEVCKEEKSKEAGAELYQAKGKLRLSCFDKSLENYDWLILFRLIDLAYEFSFILLL